MIQLITISILILILVIFTGYLAYDELRSFYTYHKLDGNIKIYYKENLNTRHRKIISFNKYMKNWPKNPITKHNFEVWNSKKNIRLI